MTRRRITLRVLNVHGWAGRLCAVAAALAVAAMVMVSSAAARVAGSATPSTPSRGSTPSEVVPRAPDSTSSPAVVGSYGPAGATCLQAGGLPDYYVTGGNTVDIQPNVARANPDGYEQVAWEAFAWDVNQNKWTLISPWQGSGILAPDVDRYLDPFGPTELIPLPLPLSGFIIGTYYAWQEWNGSAWSPWDYSQFTYADMAQYADGGSYSVSVCKGAPDMYTITAPDFTGGGMRKDGGLPPQAGSALTHTLARALERTALTRAQGQSPQSHDMPLAASRRTAGSRPRCLGKRATIVGTQGDDQIKGTRGPDVIAGLGGKDVILGHGGNDLICGGLGDDEIAGGHGADRISGGPGSDAILAGPGPDVALGGPDPDIIEPGPGNDRVNGGSDYLDILSYSFEPKGVTVDLGRGVATGSGRDVIHGFNTVIGTPHADHLTGGSTGRQFFVPYGGDDYVDGGPAGAFVAYLFSQTPVAVDLSQGVESGDGSDRLIHVNGVIGSPLNDIITGSPTGRGYLDGLAGNDSLNGDGGAYTLDGGDGSNLCSSGVAYINCQNQASGAAAPPSP